MTDNEMLELSRKIDDMLLKWADQNRTSALSLSAIVLARSMLLCDAVGSGDDFRKLCFEVSGKPLKSSKIESLH